MPEDEQEERRIHDLLRSLDHRPREITADEVMRRARRPRMSALRVAAGIAAAIGLAGVAYAMPESPVRDWVHALLGPVEPPPGETRIEPSTHGPTGASGAGAMFDPSEPLTVRVEPTDGAHLRIELIDGPEIVARLLSGEGGFTSAPNELRVRLAAADTLELLIPRTAASVEVVARDRSLFLKRGAVLRTGTEADSAGRYRIDLDDGVR